MTPRLSILIPFYRDDPSGAFGGSLDAQTSRPNVVEIRYYG